MRTAASGPIHLLALVAVALIAPSAGAAEQVTAAFPYRFDPATEEIDQGERLTFLNADTNPFDNQHDVTAAGNGPDGNPLFKTPIVPPGTEVLVEGSQYLTAGTYDFFCSVHPLGMRGTLTVTTAGAPVPRPGSDSSPGPAADTTPPNHTLAIVNTRVTAVRKRRALLVEASVTEAAEVKLAATGRYRGRNFALGSGTFAFAGSGERRLRVALTRKARKTLRDAEEAGKDVRVQATGAAKDSAGNVGSASAKGKLRA